MEAAVAIEDLVFKYPTGFQLSINRLWIRDGLTLLVGPNGSGKTTLAYLLIGLLKPIKGSINVLGIDPAKNPGDVIKRVSYCFEDTRLPPHTVVSDVVEFLGKPAEKLAVEMGLDQYLRNTYSSLSSGNRRKLVLLTCLAKEADLYIVDEPFASLDYRSKLLIGDIINREGRKKTILVSTHEAANLKPRDVVFLVDGVVVKVIRDFRPVIEIVLESPDGDEILLEGYSELNKFLRDGYKVVRIRELGLFEQLYTSL